MFITGYNDSLTNKPNIISRKSKMKSVNNTFQHNSSSGMFTNDLSCLIFYHKAFQDEPSHAKTGLKISVTSVIPKEGLAGPPLV